MIIFGLWDQYFEGSGTQNLSEKNLGGQKKILMNLAHIKLLVLTKFSRVLKNIDFEGMKKNIQTYQQISNFGKKGSTV